MGLLDQLKSAWAGMPTSTQSPTYNQQSGWDSTSGQYYQGFDPDSGTWLPGWSANGYSPENAQKMQTAFQNYRLGKGK